jgi:hypothetical protein
LGGTALEAERAAEDRETPDRVANGPSGSHLPIGSRLAGVSVAMTFNTEQCLKSYLDTNQLGRERLCLAVLTLDKRFTDVRPRHPHGGPDGGIDMDATFKSEQKAAGAIGFMVGANDSREQKKVIKKKFEKDARSARANDPQPFVFVFFTNIDLTQKEERDLKTHAVALGFAECDVFDRERLRVVLDSVDGFATRFQYLGISLSDAEQASFFARWGDDIQSVIATGFQRVERMLDRVLFLQETEQVLSGLSMVYELDRTYDADEIGHFRAFCDLLLLEPKHRIHQIFFGSTDRSERFYDDPALQQRNRPGIRDGIAGGQWEQHVDWGPSSDMWGAAKTDESDAPQRDEDEEKWERAGYSGGMGMAEVRLVRADYNHDRGFIRFQPRMSLRDLDGASFIHYLNASLAAKLKTIHVYANGYKLAEYGPDRFSVDPSPFDHQVPATFTEEELADPWVRIRGKSSSMHTFDFFGWTPKRLVVSRETPDTLKR